MSKIKIRTLDKQVDGSTMHSVVALAAGQPVGSIDVNDWHKLGGWLTMVNVVESFRRQGIAKQMLQRVLSDARAAGKTGLGLSVKADNEAAKALYESLGFRVCYTYESGLLAMAVHL